MLQFMVLSGHLMTKQNMMVPTLTLRTSHFIWLEHCEALRASSCCKDLCTTASDAQNLQQHEPQYCY